MKWAYYAIVAFVDWNDMCVLLDQQNTLFWENIELENLIKFLILGTFICKVVIFLLLIQLPNLPENPKYSYTISPQGESSQRKLMISENSCAALTYSLVISVLSNPNVNMFLIWLQTMVCI